MVQVENKYFVEYAKVLNPSANGKVFIICDHTSNRIPEEYNNFEIDSKEKDSHLACDIGSAEVTQVFALNIKVIDVLAEISRLVVDFNRPPDSAVLIPVLTHGVHIHGNMDMTKEAKESRLKRYYFRIRRTKEAGWPGMADAVDSTE